MAKPDPDPRPWACECGNIIGVMHRKNKVMVLDVFSARVTDETMPVLMANISIKNYSVLDMGIGRIPCRACGRIRTWDASEQLLKQILVSRKERNEKTDAIINSSRHETGKQLSARPDRAPSE